MTALNIFKRFPEIPAETVLLYVCLGADRRNGKGDLGTNGMLVVDFHQKIWLTFGCLFGRHKFIANSRRFAIFTMGGFFHITFTTSVNIWEWSGSVNMQRRITYYIGLGLWVFFSLV